MLGLSSRTRKAAPFHSCRASALQCAESSVTWSSMLATPKPVVGRTTCTIRSDRIPNASQFPFWFHTCPPVAAGKTALQGTDEPLTGPDGLTEFRHPAGFILSPFEVLSPTVPRRQAVAPGLPALNTEYIPMILKMATPHLRPSVSPHASACLSAPCQSAHVPPRSPRPGPSALSVPLERA